MKIDLIISADDIKENKIIGKVVVVIDMLRATTVITTAIKNGCKEVIPVVTIDEALELAKGNREKYILGGERRALKIEGFDCSNSPLDYTEEVISGKSFIITTSNGTRAINGCRNAKKLLIGSLINAKAVAKKIVEFGEDVVIVNAGTLGQFSMDDFICSGYIINCIKETMDIELTDIAYTAHHIYKEHEDIISFIKNARHYTVIMELGLEKDLEYCCTKDITEVVPYYDNGTIKKSI
jgi:2-phosphosulfolactate phosphatase